MPPRSRWRGILFRLAAVALGLLPLWGLELILIGLDWRPANAVNDPYLGFSQTRPLFELDSEAGSYRIAANRQPLFQEASFAARKPEGGIRIFCVGGSTVQGRPWGPPTAFSTWLQLNLETAAPEIPWEVVNCGGVSYASYRLRPIVAEILDYQPDLIVLYTGHNEFLEDRTYAGVRQTPGWVVSAHERMMGFRSYAWLRSLAAGSSSAPAPQQLPVDVEARLDFAGGLDTYQRDPDWRAAVVGHFEHNLRAMIELARQRKVPLVLVHPVQNLRDAAPFKSQHGNHLSAADLASFDRYLEQAGGLDGSGPVDGNRIERLQAAVQLDPQYAATQYRLGQALVLAGQVQAARPHLVRAREEDVCPLRMIDALSQVIQRVARREQVPLMDAEAWFAAQSPDGLVGGESLVDHVHPSIAGHQRLAEWMLADALAETWLPDFNWQDPGFLQRRNQRYEQHLADLPNLYFELGKDRLEGLRRWAAGEVRRQRAADTPADQ